MVRLSGLLPTRLLSTLAFLAGLLALPLASAAQDSYRIVANVNSQGITQYELQQRIKLTMLSSRIADTPANRAAVQRQVLRQMIDERIQLDEAKRASIQVSQSEVKERVQQLEQANKMPPGGIEQALRGSGVELTVLTDQIGASIAWGKLVRRKVRGQIDVTDAEIDDALNQIRRNVGKSEYRVAEIFLAVDRPEQSDEVLRNAQRILEQIRVGAPFAQMAQQFSQSSSAQNGGELGWVLPGQFDPVIEQAVARLQPGRVTEQPVRSASGWHIMALIDRRTFGTTTNTNPAEVRVNVVQLLLPLPPNAKEDEIARGIAEAQKIMAQVSKCADLRTIAARTRGASTSDSDKLRVGDLPANVAQQITSTPVGRAIGPFAVQGSIQILSVCSKEGDGGLPSRDAIQQQILSGKLEAAARRYMRDLRRAAIIDIRG